MRDTYSGLDRAPRLDHKALRRGACALILWTGAPAAASAAPFISNAPFTAKPGDVISVQGSGFGSAPKVFIKPSRQAAPAALQAKTADDENVVVQIPKTSAFDAYDLWIESGGSASAHVVLNAPKPMHFDMADVASGARFRIFGRNLYVNGAAPAVTLVDADTNAQMKATVTTGTSSPYHLDVLAPAGIVAGHAYRVDVSNGYAAGSGEATLLGHATGTDRYQIGEPWAYDFITADGPGYKAGVKGTNQADHHVYNVKTDPSLQVWAKGDGKTNDADAINRAINIASARGGVVYLPAGTYFTGTKNIQLNSNVVLQGAGIGSTKIQFKPTATANGSFYLPGGITMAGIADLSVQNLDRTSLYQQNLGTGHQPVSKVFLQRLEWDLGSGLPVTLMGDRIAVLNCKFSQAVNFQHGDVALKTGGLGPFSVEAATNLHFKGNTVRWATGQNKMFDLDNAIIENNVFTRSASDIITVGPDQLSWNVIIPIKLGERLQRPGRQLAIAFAKDVVLQNNTFNVSDGELVYKFNDGETIQNEAGATFPREDWGTVTAADAGSISDDGKCAGTCAWRFYSSSIVAVVSGAGAGQWRRAMALTGNTFKLDRPFDVIPAVGDHFVVSAPAFENAIIRHNAMSNNPMGVDLYHGMLLNVSVTGNKLTNNGGINVVMTQRNEYSSPDPKRDPHANLNSPFNVARNIEINGNTVTNTNGRFPAFIAVAFQFCTQTTFWGKSTFGIELRNNQLTARAGTTPYRLDQGYYNFAAYQNPFGSYVDEGKGALIGSVLQANKCVNCPVSYRVSAGAIDTTIWNSVSTASPGVARKFIDDLAFGAGWRSLRTLVGHD